MQGACVSYHALDRGSVCPGGVCLGGVCLGGGGISQHVLDRGIVCRRVADTPSRILRDTVNKRAVRILLEYILVIINTLGSKMRDTFLHEPWVIGVVVVYV